MKAIEYKAKPIPGRCSAKYCNHKAATTLCGGCRSKKSRLSDPVRYAYQNLKDHAKARNVLFTITIEQFRDWCSKVTYVGHSGRSKDSFDVDRRHNDVGYHIDNIQVLKKVDNIKKYFHYDFRTKQVMYQVAEPPEPGPFSL